MNQNVTAAVNAARQAIQAEAARLKKEIVLRDGELQGLRKLLSEMEPLLAMFNGQPVQAKPPSDDDVGKLVSAMLTPVAPPSVKKKRKRQKPTKPPAATKRPTGALTAQVLALLADSKARESSDIASALPHANESTVRSSIHTLMKTGEILARGEAGRRRYTIAPTAKARVVSQPAASRRSAPMRELILAYLKTHPGGASAAEVFASVAPRYKTTRTNLGTALYDMKEAGMITGRANLSGPGLLYSMPAPAPVKASASKHVTLNDMVLDAVSKPLSMDEVRMAIAKRRAGTTAKTLWATMKFLRKRGLVAATGPSGAYRYVRATKG